MNLVDRAKNILLTPKTEWDVIAAEASPDATLISGYVVPLAALNAAAGFIGQSLVGVSLPFVGYYRTPIVAGVVGAILGFVLTIVGVYVFKFIINALAPNFGAQKNDAQALKVAAYCATPVWVLGVVRVLPALSILVLLGAIYAVYLLYLGLQQVMKAPADKAAGYTAVTAIVAIVVAIVIGFVTAAVLGTVGLAARGGAGLLGGFGASAPAADVQFDRNSTLGKLQELGNKLEESGKKMDAAEKSGDANAQAAAAMEGLGTLLGGGKRVDPVAIDVLKPLVPDTFAGLPKTSSSADRTGFANLMVSKAEATYGSGDKQVTLEISDTGGVSGLVGLAGWAGMQGEHDNDQETERVSKVDGRLVHEKVSKTGGSNEFGLVLADRFVVNAEGRGVDLAALKAAVAGLDLAKLEALEDAGVQH